MKDLVIDSYLSVKSHLNPHGREHCFELFGYDFLVDEDFRVWLLEVNTNPYLGIPNEGIAKLLSGMLNHMLQIVVDPYFPPAARPLEEDENQFELIYSEFGGATKREPFNTRSVFTHPIYPVEELRQYVGRQRREETIRKERQSRAGGAAHPSQSAGRN